MNKYSAETPYPLSIIDGKVLYEIEQSIIRHMNKSAAAKVDKRHLMRFDVALKAIKDKHEWISFTQLETMKICYKDMFGSIKAGKLEKTLKDNRKLSVFQELGN